jgi:hypothetical protein
MITVGQYVRAVLADGLAAALPDMAGFEALMDREGIVVEVHHARGTLVLEDYVGHEHVCHLASAKVVDLQTLDSFLHNWAVLRAADMGVSPAMASP